MAQQSVLNIINRALRLIGVAQTSETASSAEAADAFSVLNMMIGQWNNESLMLYGYMNELFPLIPTTGVYTIGPGGDIDTVRPQKIVRAFVRYNPSGLNTFQYDYQLEIVPNDKYQEIFLKQLTVTYPIYLFYDNKFPLGTITLYPYPSQACSLGLSSWNQILQFTNLIQDIDMPPGYESALSYNLAVEIAPEYGKQIDQIIYDKANETKAAIMRTNHTISYMKTDTALLPKRTFNILTGSYQ
jgi:hypothetical protein